MAEFSGGEEKIIRENEPIVFENKTDSSFDVGMGVSRDRDEEKGGS